MYGFFFFLKWRAKTFIKVFRGVLTPSNLKAAPLQGSWALAYSPSLPGRLRKRHAFQLFEKETASFKSLPSYMSLRPTEEGWIVSVPQRMHSDPKSRDTLAATQESLP